MNKKKVKELKKRIKPIQVEWVKTILPEDMANTITIDNVASHVPEQKYVVAQGKRILSFMTDRWVLKFLKKHPEIKTYKQVEEILNGV